ncbi:fucose-1-phosphate guanylyltransferase-like [Daphnia carinata]|uniref:fucose-1-phosphate guanylyltransferase-like n=1 Tax=Daphnia carinata TaxID=120202 RepID=UPI00257EB43A|nr:fucose-1-phosphate guanylyltransferase-like [Daphnia carinata]
MEQIQKYMVRLAQNFNKSFSEEKAEFWDCLVISAADEKQKDCFQQQLDEQLKKGELPRGTKYLVIADCPGSALGSGGSTFHILKLLKDLFGNELFHMKIWISHAGGSSKRLPNLSCTGKLFCPLPLEIEGKAITILNLKIIITSPFLKLMKNGGIFICASDDVETYCLDELESIVEQSNKLTEDGVVAIAHPSSITIGNTHGVYVLPESPKKDENCWLIPCLEVLQKPNYSTMQMRKALVKLGNGEERVYTDSMFWCGPGLVKKMVTFAQENSDLYSTETCIYGDFLACMGSRPAEEKLYLKSTSVSSTIKGKIASHFGETPLNIMVLERSKFYHLGTMPEYLENLNPTSELFQTLAMKPIAQSLCRKPPGIQGIITTSCLEADVESMSGSVMDSCIVNVPVVCERQTIVSHCVIDDPLIKVIPSCWMFHTAAVKQDNAVLYVTIAFRIDDDLKGRIEQSRSWNGTTLEHPTSTLWQARLFAGLATMSESFTATWKMVSNREKNEELIKTLQRFSMEDIVQHKYIPAMMQHRENVLRKICA